MLSLFFLFLPYYVKMFLFVIFIAHNSKDCMISIFFTFLDCFVSIVCRAVIELDISGIQCAFNEKFGYPCTCEYTPSNLSRLLPYHYLTAHTALYTLKYGRGLTFQIQFVCVHRGLVECVLLHLRVFIITSITTGFCKNRCYTMANSSKILIIIYNIMRIYLILL